MSAFVYYGLIMSMFFFHKTLAMTDEMMEMAKMLHDACVEETGVDEGLIKRASSGDFVEDQNLKCYMKCLMEQVSAIDDDGEIDIEVILAVMPEELLADIEPIIRKCGTIKGADDCDSIYQTQKCYQKNYPEGYFLI